MHRTGLNPLTTNQSSWKGLHGEKNLSGAPSALKGYGMIANCITINEVKAENGGVSDEELYMGIRHTPNMPLSVSELAGERPISC